MEIFLPIHNMLHELLGQKFCGWPGAFGFCPEFWFGFGAAWIIIKNKPHAKLLDIVKKIVSKDKEDKDKEESTKKE